MANLRKIQLPFSVLIPGYTKGVWLGYSDIQKEGRYVSMSNAEELGYNNWHKTEPNNGGVALSTVLLYMSNTLAGSMSTVQQNLILYARNK